WRRVRVARRPTRRWCWPIFSRATNVTGIARRPLLRRPPTLTFWIIPISTSKPAFARPSRSSRLSAPRVKRDVTAGSVLRPIAVERQFLFRHEKSSLAGNGRHGAHGTGGAGQRGNGISDGQDDDSRQQDKALH